MQPGEGGEGHSSSSSSSAVTWVLSWCSSLPGAALLSSPHCCTSPHPPSHPSLPSQSSPGLPELPSTPALVLRGIECFGLVLFCSHSAVLLSRASLCHGWSSSQGWGSRNCHLCHLQLQGGCAELRPRFLNGEQDSDGTQSDFIAWGGWKHPKEVGNSPSSFSASLSRVPGTGRGRMSWSRGCQPCRRAGGS